MKGRILKEGWEVEWTYSLDGDGFGGVDPDTAKTRFADFATKDEALAFAKQVLPQDKWGAVSVTPFHSEPYEEGLPATFREYDGDSIEVSE